MESPDLIKRELEEAIEKTASELISDTNLRQRKLPLETLLRLMIGMEGGSLARELHCTGVDVTPSAFSQRRGQVPPEIFRKVFLRFNGAGIPYGETYRGYRVLAVDGTCVNMPRNPQSESFVQNEGNIRGYNQLHLNSLYDVCSKTYFDCAIQPQPQADEIGALVEMLKANDFSTPTLIIADRGYESYNLIAHLIEKPNVDFLIRVKQNHSAMREIAKLPMFELDCVINFTITTTQTNEDKQKRYIHLQLPKKSKPGATTRRGRWDFGSPYPMRLRIVRFQLNTGEFETIATSLPPSFTVDEIRELYHMRWGIETSFRDLKYSLGLVNLHGKSDNFVRQEIYAALTMFNFTSRISRLAAVRQPKDGVYAYRVNFKMAVALCREYFREPNADAAALMRNIAKHLVPIREGRQDQRKIKPKSFVGFTYRVAA